MSAYEFPLLIKYLLLSPLRQKARKEIVYRDLVRYDYPTLHDRIGRLGSTLSQLGVRPGDTVAVMDWDSHRYLEAYFAVPMLGAVLHTVNIRLAPEQVLYTLNHAEGEVVLCNTEFLPLLQALRDRLTSAKKFICITDQPGESEDFAWDGDYETMLAAGNPAHEFPDFDENTRATIFYTTGTTGLPKGVFFTHRQLVLHTLAVLVEVGLRRDDVYMPITPMFHVHAWGFPYAATTAGLKQVYPAAMRPILSLHSTGTKALRSRTASRRSCRCSFRLPLQRPPTLRDGASTSAVVHYPKRSVKRRLSAASTSWAATACRRPAPC